MTRLAEKKSQPCSSDMPPMNDQEIQEQRAQIPQWEVFEENGEKRLRRSFKFDDFRQALDFTNQVGEAAEEEDHHPTLFTEWGRVVVTWWTHKIGGLHVNDFIMAARSDDLYQKAKS